MEHIGNYREISTIKKIWKNRKRTYSDDPNSMCGGDPIRGTLLNMVRQGGGYINTPK